MAIIPVKAQSLSGWFDTKEVSGNVWLIDDHKAANIYLIEGTDSALLIDTGIGVADLSSLVKKLTDKPLIIVNTHGHPDHAGADYQFKKVYIHSADSTAARSYNLPESRKRTAQMMLKNADLQEGDVFKGKERFTQFIAVREGYIFNLGGRLIKVMETPGHTPGSICLLDMENKLLFTGDNNNMMVWLFLDVCRPLSEYLVSLEKQSKRISEFNTMFPGHGIPIKSDFVLDQIECVKSILNGKCSPEPYKSFAGDAMLCKYGRAIVAYNPDNL